MGLTYKNENNYNLSDDIANFFSLPIEEEKTNYQELKAKIYQMNNLDKEEKANIINKINSLTINKPNSINNKIVKEIEDFKIKYNL